MPDKFPPMARAYRIVAWLVAALAGACSEADGPGGLEGTYQLVELNSQPLPYNDLAGCCIYTAGSLALTASGYTVSITFQNKNSGTGDSVNEEGTYSSNGSALFFQRTGGNFTMYFYNATLNGRTIRLQLGGSAPGAGDQFAAAFRR